MSRFTYIKSNELFRDLPVESLYNKVQRPVIVADHLRNAENMGALIRLADNVGASAVYFLGSEGDVNRGRLQRAAASSFRNISWAFIDDQKLEHLLPEQHTSVALETANNSTNLFLSSLPENPVFYVGNEVSGIRQSLLQNLDQCVFIPVPGPTRSLNVSHATSVLLFEWLRQMMHIHYKY